ncbi:MAG TPA: hypothetical protein VFF65_08305 [Phycisphaerales bacterium]|nr:hypothetical protein [Phycisphaerales bacterium]
MYCSKVIPESEVARGVDRPGSIWKVRRGLLLRRPDYFCNVHPAPGGKQLRLATWKNWEYWVGVSLAAMVCIGIDRSFATPGLSDGAHLTVFAGAALGFIVGIVRLCGEWRISIDDADGACMLRFRSFGLTWTEFPLGTRWSVLVHPSTLSVKHKGNAWQGMVLMLHASNGSIVVGAFAQGDAHVRFAGMREALGVEALTIGSRLFARH